MTFYLKTFLTTLNLATTLTTPRLVRSFSDYQRIRNFVPMKGIEKGKVKALVVNSKDDVYAALSYGSIYRSNEGKSDFSLVQETKKLITALAVDSKDNLYAAVSEGTLYIARGQNNLVVVKKINGMIWSLAFDKKDNSYIGSVGAAIYQNDEIKIIKQTLSKIWCLVSDSNNNIYAGTNEGVYVSEGGVNDFVLLSGTNGVIRSLTVDVKDNVYALGYLDESFYSFSQEVRNIVYQKINQSDHFVPIEQVGDQFWCLAVGSKNNIYIAGEEGQVYESQLVSSKTA